MIEYRFLISWNTGRPYTERGQRISVHGVYQGDELVAYYMADIDRGIDYHFELPVYEGEAIDHDDPREVRRYVQWCYDFNRNYLPYRAWFNRDVYQDALAGGIADYPRWEPLYV